MFSLITVSILNIMTGSMYRDPLTCWRRRIFEKYLVQLCKGCNASLAQPNVYKKAGEVNERFGQSWLSSKFQRASQSSAVSSPTSVHERIKMVFLRTAPRVGCFLAIVAFAYATGAISDESEKVSVRDYGGDGGYGGKKDYGGDGGYGGKKDYGGDGGYGGKKGYGGDGGYGEKKDYGGDGGYGGKKDYGGDGGYGGKKDYGGDGGYGGHGGYGGKKDYGGEDDGGYGDD
jgi:hypothetical protein